MSKLSAESAEKRFGMPGFESIVIIDGVVREHDEQCRVEGAHGGHYPERWLLRHLGKRVRVTLEAIEEPEKT